MTLTAKKTKEKVDAGKTPVKLRNTHQNNDKSKSESSSVHVVFGSECTKGMDWKSIGVFHSFRTSGWIGNITRLMACSKDQLLAYEKRAKDVLADPSATAADLYNRLGPTYVHPNYVTIDGYKDSVSYNKPAALMHFVNDVKIEEDFILYIDADMLLRRVIDPADFGAREGLVVTEYVWYIEEGIANGLAEQFLGSHNEAALERATYTHGGYYHLLHKEDAKKVTPRWLYYTQQMRHHPEKYWAKLPGSTLKEDIDTVQKGIKYGGVPWITEMYGYAFAAAEIGLDHLFTRGGGGVLYGDDLLSLRHAGPFASHYTLSCHVPSIEHWMPQEETQKRQEAEDKGTSYIFDKHTFREFDPFDCNDGYIFPSPPRTPKVDEAAASCAENVERLNEALCDNYRRTCPVESAAYVNCNDVVNKLQWSHRHSLDKVIPAPCGDTDGEDECQEAVKNGDCEFYPASMNLQCLKSCGFCADADGDGKMDEYPCVDRETEDDCKALAAQKECILNPTFMTANCRRTCGFCVKNSGKNGNSNTSSRVRQVFDEIASGTEEDSSMTVFVATTAFILVGILFCRVCKFSLKPSSPLLQRKKSS